MAANPYAKYKEQAVMTMTQGEMIVRLYDEIDLQLNKAIVAIEEKDMVKANLALQKAQKIIRHFQATLNHNYEVAAGLNKIYEYLLKEIIKANIKKDSEPIKIILPLISELKEVFVQGERLARIG